MTIMLFRRIRADVEESYCRRYTVCAGKSMGKWSFCAWRRGIFEGAVPTLLTFPAVKTAEEAREVCRQHAAAEALKQVAA